MIFVFDSVEFFSVELMFRVLTALSFAGARVGVCAVLDPAVGSTCSVVSAGNVELNMSCWSC